MARSKEKPMLRTFREADFLETSDNLIFDVKGLIHPPDRVIAFLRYYPSEDGERTRNNMKYRKVYSLDERYRILRDRFPSYIYFDSVYDSMMQGVPLRDIAHLYKPTERLLELSKSHGSLDDFEEASLAFCEILSESAGITLNKIGLSGSVLVKLHTLKSDIDVTVYGSKSCFAVYEALGSLYNDPHSLIKPYNENELRKLFNFRSSDTFTEWESFLKTERRKRLQGVYKKYEYFLRFIRDWDEVNQHYGDVTYKNLGKATIKATVVDDSEALFTPCTYKVKTPQTFGVSKPGGTIIAEVSSFRGRFCGVARAGETIIARGKLELVVDESGHKHYRIIVGGERDDYLTLV